MKKSNRHVGYSFAELMQQPIMLEGDFPAQKPSSTGAVKYDGPKPSMSLLPGNALRRCAEVMDYGKQKYAAHNWRKGFDHSRLLDACLRHLSYVQDGEMLDKESGLPHMAHAAINLLFLLDHQETHPKLNDLFHKKGK